MNDLEIASRIIEVFYLLMTITVFAGVGLLFLFLGILDGLGSNWPPNMLVNNYRDYIEHPTNPTHWYTSCWELPKSAPYNFQNQIKEKPQWMIMG
ncbi:MAG: hypothetical protein Q8O83_02815 [bacterium]|nr:hypothetical protein [bacterium]